MTHEARAEVRIVCEEERKVSRTTLIVESWSEDPLVTITIQRHNLKTDKRQGDAVDVDPAQLIAAIRAVVDAMPNRDGE